MANIVDYLKWRGDILLDDYPFNDVDNLVLSLLSYLGFDGIVPSERSNKTVLLSDACQKMIESIKKDPSLISGLSRIDTTFLEALIDSPRFAKARLGKYVNRLDHNKNMQFLQLQKKQMLLYQFHSIFLKSRFPYKIYIPSTLQKSHLLI